MSSRYLALEIVVVDDCSSDGAAPPADRAGLKGFQLAAIEDMRCRIYTELLSEVVERSTRRRSMSAPWRGPGGCWSRLLETEVGAYLERHRHERDGRGHALVVRNGKARARKVTCGAGTISLRAPRVNDQRVDEEGRRQRFTRWILRPYMRRSP